MTVTTNIATVRRAATKAVVGKGDGSQLIYLGARTVELGASDATSTIDFGDIPSNLRIAGCSKVYWDDCATSGAPTLDIGLFAIDSNITSDDDAINDGLDLATATTTGVSLIKDIANYGKMAYELVSGQSTDPRGALKIKGTIKDAATNQTGTVTLDVYGYID
jgi:hypothetical protein